VKRGVSERLKILRDSYQVIVPESYGRWYTATGGAV